jgi:hypothetical protein
MMLLSALPLASILTLVARTAHPLSEGLFRSRSTIFRRAPGRPGLSVLAGRGLGPARDAAGRPGSRDPAGSLQARHSQMPRCARISQFGRCTDDHSDLQTTARTAATRAAAARCLTHALRSVSEPEAPEPRSWSRNRFSWPSSRGSVSERDSSGGPCHMTESTRSVRRPWPVDRGTQCGNDLQFRRVPLGVAGFLTCAGLRRFALPGSRSPGFPGFSLADPLAACGARDDAPGPSGWVTFVA